MTKTVRLSNGHASAEPAKTAHNTDPMGEHGDSHPFARRDDGLSLELAALLDMVRQAPERVALPPPAITAPLPVTPHDIVIPAADPIAELATALAADAATKRDTTLPGVAPESTAHLADTRLPTGWYQSVDTDAEQASRPMLRSGLIGVALGLALVPIVGLSSGYWSTGGVPPAQPALNALTQSFVPAAKVRIEPVVQVDVALVSGPALVQSGTVTATATAPQLPSLAIARAQIEAGDIFAARKTLGGEDLVGRAEAQFTLAETYDPNWHAARGTRGVDADPERARAHYQLAQALGFASARERLKALH